MMPKDLPKCLCGGEVTWTDGNSTFQPGLCQQYFQCVQCSRPALFLSHAGGNILLTPTTQQRKLPSKTIPWVNEVLLPTWRDCEDRLNAARKPIEARWRNYACDEIEVPRDTKNEDIPDERREQWRNFWELLQTYRAYRTPVGFEKPPTPPQLPEGVTAHLLIEYGEYRTVWEDVKREDSLAQAVPPDPVRVQHDAFFNRVFDALKKSIEHEFTAEHVRNEYCGADNQPWFKFVLGKDTFIVGPRKRVTAIEVTSPDGMKTERIRAAAMQAGVTYTANGDWQSDASTVNTLEVHAWNEAQLLEFLKILAEESLVGTRA